MEQRPYTSVQKVELYVILMVLRDFKEPLNIVTDSQYAERVILHTEFIPDDIELTSPESQVVAQVTQISRWQQHQPGKPAWPQVVDQIPDNFMALGGHRSHGHQLRPCLP